MSKRKFHILLGENETALARALRRSLVAHGYEVSLAHTGEESLELFAQRSPDLLLLDLALPQMNGLEVCKRIRALTETLPIIVLSDLNKERNKVVALDLGADDYIAKPFGMDEVLARIRVALRHAAYFTQPEGSILALGPLTIDFTQHLVTLNGKETPLTRTEYELLRLFVKHQGKILTQQMLLSQVWKMDEKKRAYLHVYVGRLRRKIEPDPAHPRFLQTLPGIGYRFRDE